MINIAAAFAICNQNNCIETSQDLEFYVIDTDAGKSEIYKGNVEELTPPFFKVNNPSKKEISTLAIDQCILFDADGKKCDFAVYDENIFCFVELKKSGRKAARKAQKKDAAKQLEHTIDFFTGNCDFTNYTIEACLCVGYRVAHPRAKASSLALQKLFIDRFNVELFEGSEITFI